MNPLSSDSLEETEIRLGGHTAFLPGDTLARRYEVVHSLGKGSGGTVYLCRDFRTQDLKAIKVLNESHMSQMAFERFYREAKAANRVVSPYVVRSFDVIADDGLFAYSMEYVPGKNLGDLIRSGQRLEPLFVCRAVWEIAQGLTAIHKEGIIHRDLKPSNVILVDNVHFKIGDFGVARVANEYVAKCGMTSNASLQQLFGLQPASSSTDSFSLTGNGEFVGTADYVSPEYVHHGQVDERSDIYALGTLAYEMATGSVPFSNGNRWSRLEARIVSRPPPILDVRHDIQPALNALIMSCLETCPEDRPQSAFEIAAFMEDAMRRCEYGSRNDHAATNARSDPRRGGARWG
jgi:eukaryotic-like serine/threonine-protein kinase